MSIREFLEDVRENPKFWTLLVLYSLLTPLWFFCAYVRRHDKVEMVVMIFLGLYCGINALFKWMDV